MSSARRCVACVLAETLASPVASDPAVARDLAGRVLDEVQALNQMTQEMLDLAAIESGRQVARLVPLALQEVVALPVDRLREQARRKGVGIESEIAPDIRVLADLDQAGRAVQNVLDNAVKFTPAADGWTGKRSRDDGVVLRIVDEDRGSRRTISGGSSSASIAAIRRAAPPAPGWGWPSPAISSRLTAARLGPRTDSRRPEARSSNCVF
jgi:hypothetical protein